MQKLFGKLYLRNLANQNMFKHNYTLQKKEGTNLINDFIILNK